MTPFQQMLLGAGPATKKTYMDDVFSTFLYKGDDGVDRHVDNGIDINGEGGLVWVNKRQGGAYGGTYVADTARGLGKQIFTAGTDGQVTLNRIKPASGSNTGFNVNNDSDVNSSSNTYASWSYRKAPGFFDVVTYTGNGVQGRDIPHNLGSVPGFIAVKRTDGTEDWTVYHRSVGATKHTDLNNSYQFVSDNKWDSTEPTSSVFTVGAHERVNYNTYTYVAYLWAGGESTAATARSVDLDGTDDYLTTDQSTNYAMGTGDFTVEGWFKKSSKNNFGYFMNNTNGLSGNYGVSVHYYHTYGLSFYASGSKTDTNFHPPNGQWFHLALVRNSGTTSLYYNGSLLKSASDNTDYTDANCSRFVIGGYDGPGYLMIGSVSNFRVVKGTAVYTSDFKPPTEPLTSITNTKLLCCNNSSVTGTTTGTVTAAGNETANIDSPFDDPAGFVFGKDQDQGSIKCGSYVGNGSSTGPEIHLGWEPQWLLVKNASSNSTNWTILDTMRGIIDGANEYEITTNTAAGESNTNGNRMSLTPTGFKIKDTASYFNTDGDTYIFLAIRRPDGYVGKPADAGTSVFAMDTGLSSQTLPEYDSGFPVDFAINAKINASWDKLVGARLIGAKYLRTNTDDAEASSSNFVWDHNAGWSTSSWGAEGMSWMWKRHAGFDVVNWKGDGVTGRKIRHNLSKAPEMIWIKTRESLSWYVYHKGLNGGTNPEQYKMNLNLSSAESASAGMLNNTAPTSTHFTLGSFSGVNGGTEIISMLFASVDNISKCGYYSGNNSSSGPTVTTGFSPRFILIKRANGIDNWFVFDTLRGINNSGNDARIKLDEAAAQTDNSEWLSISSTGFTLKTSDTGVNASSNYIYYAHA
tara:strand:+ start:617 stop:3196 length:2580 start_codon:yes stop_codon:yes gene_type:complete